MRAMPAAWGAVMHEEHVLHVDGTAYPTRLTPKFQRRSPPRPRSPGDLCAVIPGVIWEVHVEPGAQVAAGDPLLTLEAMKMLNPIVAPRAGRIAKVHVRTGDRVAKNQLLIELA